MDTKGVEVRASHARGFVHLQVVQLGQFKHLGGDRCYSIPVQLQHQEGARQIVKIARFHGYHSVAIDVPVGSVKVRGLLRFLWEGQMCSVSPLQMPSREPDRQLLTGKSL